MNRTVRAVGTAVSDPTPSDVTVYWRPSCPFCMVLRRGLRKAGLEVEEVNIWDDPAAAAIVRGTANGNETVPTVRVGERFFVNPSARDVVAAAAELRSM
jgi:glutaredoxin-like protein